MKFSELSNKDRYRIIRMGVQNGIHSVSDIEHIFDDGGDLNDDEQKQLEWSKNWHTQRVNYMPWTDEQKAAYLKAIDSTYSGSGFTRDPYKVMGFTPKGNNININYKSAGNTEYGDQAETSGLVHELAHKLSYNANRELNKLDNFVPTPEDAMLRNQKLNRLMHPLEIGGLENAKTFVDYNAKPDIVKKQEKQFKKDGIYNSKLVEDDGYGHNAIESKARIDELRYIMNLDPRLIDINAGNVKVWRKKGKIPPSLKDYSDEQIAKMLNTFAYNNTNNTSNLLAKGGNIDPILKDRKPKAEFYQRLKDPNRATIKDWESDNIATHKMSYVTEGDNAIVYPEVQNINGKLVDFTRPPYDKWAGYENAIQRGDTIQMTPKEAEYWTQHYKEFYPNFNKYAEGGDTETQKNERINYDDKGAVIGSAIGSFIGGIPGYFIGQTIGSGAIRRGIETLMRTTANANPIKAVQKYIETHNPIKTKNKEDEERAKSIVKYIFTGKPTGEKGYYNSLAETPEISYTGFIGKPDKVTTGYDLIDAALYDKEIDEAYGLKKIPTSKNSYRNPEIKYIEEQYSKYINNVQTYITNNSNQINNIENSNIKQNTTTDVDGNKIIKITSPSDHNNNPSWNTEVGIMPNVGGYSIIDGVTPSGNNVSRGYDVWDFQADDYIKKQGITNPFLKLGVRFVDKMAKPVILKTGWQN